MDYEKVATLREEVKALGVLEEKLEQQIDEELSKTLVRCALSENSIGRGCGNYFSISELTYIQTHWYEGSHGCNGGDIWHSGEGNFDCPKCGCRNRFYYREYIEKLKYLFKCIKEEYGK